MKASDQTQWTPVQSKTRAKRQPANQSQKEEKEDEEEKEEEITRGSIMVPNRHDGGRQHAQRTPNRDQQFTDTTESIRSTRESLRRIHTYHAVPLLH
jgi:hypothetical protein